MNDILYVGANPTLTDLAQVSYPINDFEGHERVIRFMGRYRTARARAEKHT